MSMKDANSALTQAYIDMGLALPTGYEGVQFDPVGVEDHVRLTIQPAINAPATNGIGGQDEEAGFMQIDFLTEYGKGTAKLLGWADTVQNSFVAGYGFTFNTTIVNVDSVERTRIITDGGFLRITLTVNWFTRFTRPAL
jgi:hypothetical protein